VRCLLPTQSLLNVWVTDCLRKRIVPWCYDPFVALSYVLGADPATIDAKVLLKSIHDAIISTLPLGQRYLWFDRTIRCFFQ
jgi:hypothetical protein